MFDFFTLPLMAWLGISSPIVLLLLLILIVLIIKGD